MASKRPMSRVDRILQNAFQKNIESGLTIQPEKQPRPCVRRQLFQFVCDQENIATSTPRSRKKVNIIMFIGT